MNLNRKGFTLVEVLAVIVILSMLIAIMIPSVNYLIEKNKEDNYNTLKNSILSATKVYLSDNRYNITLEYNDNGGLCSEGESDEDLASIDGKDLNSLLGVSKIPVSLLVDAKKITTNSEGEIIDPREKNKTLKLSSSYVVVKYQCSTKDYTYTLESNSLKWE